MEYDMESNGQRIPTNVGIDSEGFQALGRERSNVEESKGLGG
jgi:hypothetical protein